MSIVFLTEKGMFIDGKPVEQEGRMEIWPWYRVMWYGLFKPWYRYVVYFKPKDDPSRESGAKE